MSKSVSHNAFCVFNKLIYWYYLARPSNLACHDLTVGKIADIQLAETYAKVSGDFLRQIRIRSATQNRQMLVHTC